VSQFWNQHSARIMPEPNSGCWFWMGQINQHGYGRIRLADKRTQVVHRFAFETDREPVPAGMQLDHLCRVRCCCNPDHLEIVTHGENARRGVLSRLHFDPTRPDLCIHGHDLSRFGRRYGSDLRCTECARVSRRKWEAKRTPPCFE
jgi:hypothetical protein